MEEMEGGGIFIPQGEVGCLVEEVRQSLLLFPIECRCCSVLPVSER